MEVEFQLQKLHRKDLAPATQGNEDKNSDMPTACLELFSKKMLLIFFSIFFTILTEMGMGFPKRPFPHNNKYQQRCGETEQSL